MLQAQDLNEEQLQQLSQALEVLDAYIEAVEVGTLENLDDLNAYLSKLSGVLERLPFDEGVPDELKAIREQLEKLVQVLGNYREALIKANEAQSQQAAGTIAYQKRKTEEA